MAERHPAVHTPRRLFTPFLVGKPGLHFAIIVDPFFNGPITGLLPAYL
jgi:hypothetical protein